MPIPSFDENKTTWRRYCRALVVSNPVESSRLITSFVAQLLAERPEWNCIATFFPLSGEPDLTALHSLLPERDFVYPRMIGSDMTFHRVTDPSQQLIPTCWNLREPHPELPSTCCDEIHVMLCPGMAFDAAGHRLGKGRGFYDRYLAACQPSGPTRIGISFASSVFPGIPHETHDAMMDLIITENGPMTVE